MPHQSHKHFNLPWNQYDQYWISIFPRSGDFSMSVGQLLASEGMIKPDDHVLAIRTPGHWKDTWDRIYAGLSRVNGLSEVDVAISPGADLPGGAMLSHKSPAVINTIAESLWLGDAMLGGRLMCYMQPVMIAADKPFGYESFARVKAQDGTIIAGDKIIAAAKALGIEYMVDRFLHVQAITTFAASNFSGFLFINFFPGFIHRPAVYLEGLSETVRNFGITPKNIVLDFTNSEALHAISHLKSVCDYGRSKGYSIALDDIISLDSARRLVPEISPDFVKIDRQLALKIDEPGQQDVLRQIIDIAHNAGSSVIGEGIETNAMFQQLKSLGVDLFQGYLFSPPLPVEAALGRKAV